MSLQWKPEDARYSQLQNDNLATYSSIPTKEEWNPPAAAFTLVLHTTGPYG